MSSAMSTLVVSRYMMRWDALTIDIATTTSTISNYTYVTSTISTDLTTTVYAASSTITLTGTQTVTQVTDVPAATTIIAHTASGFTPVACLADYLKITTTIYYTTTSTRGDSTSFVAGPETSSISFTEVKYTATTTTTTTRDDTSTVIIQTTVTTTSTRPAESTRTAYAACASNNGMLLMLWYIKHLTCIVVAASPSGLYLTGDQAAIDRNNASGILQAQRLEVPAIDAVDCCAQCQVWISFS